MAAPSTAVLDTFNRANGSIATGESRWTTPGLYQGSVAVLITGNQAYGSSSFAEAYWNAATYTDCEVGYTIATPHGTGQYAYVWARGQNPNAANASGYELIIERSAGTDTWTLNRVISQSPTELATRSQEISAGDAFALVVLGTGATVTLQIWYRASGGSWAQLGADVSDTSGSRITAAGRIGFGSNSTTIRIDDVFGGAQAAGPTGADPAAAAGAATTSATGASRAATAIAAAAGAATAAALSTGGVTGADPTAAAGAASASAVGSSVAAATATPAAGVAEADISQGQGALRLYGTADDGIDRVRFPLTTSAGAASTPVNVGAGDFTYELWIRCAYADNGTTATDVRYSNIILDRDIWDHPRGHVPLGVTRRSGVLVLIFGANNGSGAWPAIRGTTQVGDNAWHHVAVVRDGATVRLFVDGIQDASGTFSTADWSYPLSYTPTGGLDNEYLVLGAEKHDYAPGVNGYAGLVDELRVSDVARYTSAFTPPSAPFAPDADAVGLYHLDSASGTAALDSATVSGAPTDGELRVGGPDNGPTWSADHAFGTVAAAASPAAGVATASAAGAARAAAAATGATATATAAATGGAGVAVAATPAAGVASAASVTAGARAEADPTPAAGAAEASATGTGLTAGAAGATPAAGAATAATLAGASLAAGAPDPAAGIAAASAAGSSVGAAAPAAAAGAGEAATLAGEALISGTATPLPALGASSAATLAGGSTAAATAAPAAGAAAASTLATSNPTAQIQGRVTAAAVARPPSAAAVARPPSIRVTTA